MAIPIELDHGSRQSLQGQLFAQLRHLILGGRLKPGTPVPASRALAEQLSISRNTVLLVYDRLIAEGYLQARKAIGTYVSLELPETCLAAARRAVTSSPTQGERATPGAGLEARRTLAGYEGWRSSVPYHIPVRPDNRV